MKVMSGGDPRAWDVDWELPCAPSNQDVRAYDGGPCLDRWLVVEEACPVNLDWVNYSTSSESSAYYFFSLRM